MESSISTDGSSISLKREITLMGSLRESTHPIQLLARNTSNGHFLSIDPVAIRIWSTRRQIKAYHIPPDNKIMALKAVGAYYLSNYDMYAIVYSCKKTISEDDEEEQTMPQGGLIQFWYSSLLLSQEVAIDLPPIRDCVFNEARLELILVDITGMCNVMQMGHTYRKEKKLPHFQQGLSNPVTPQTPTPLHGTRSSLGGSSIHHNPLFGPSSVSDHINLKLTCIRIQSFEIEDFEYFVEVGIIDEHKFMILAFTYMLCYTNPKSNSDEKQDFDDDEVNEERYVHTHRFNFPFRSEARPCALLHLDGHVYGIGYGDGQIQVLLCDLERTYDSNMSIDAIVLVETRAHRLDPDKHKSRMGLSKGSWSSHMPGAHEIEFVSIGDDNKIIVWGVSQSKAVTVGESEFHSVYDSVGAESLTDVEIPEQQFSLHKIGVFDIIPDPTTSLNLRKYRKIWSGKKHLLSFDLVEDLHENINMNMNGLVLPSRRQVVCCLGGMLSFLEVHQLHRPISKYTYPKELVNVESGPLLCQFDDLIGAQSEASPSMSENRGSPVTSRQYLTSLLVLQADILDIVDPDRGCLIKQLPILYLADSTKPLISTIGKDNEFLMNVKAREGTPSSCFYCTISEVIFVGYSSGGVNIVYPYDKTQTTFRIDTTGVHDCAIKKFTSFLQRAQREYVVYLMIGDAKGKLSVWTLSSSSEYELVWTSDAHASEILTITSVCGMNHQGENVMQLERVVLTACRGGIVKAWVQHKSGKMMLTSFFKCDVGMSSFFGTLVTKGNIGTDNSFMDSQVGEHVDSVNLRSMDGSHPTATAVDKQEIRVVCLCGLVSGAIQGWILSSDTLQGQGGEKGFNESTLSNVSRIGAADGKTAAWTLSYSSLEISSICKMCNSRPNALSTSHFVFMCTAASGSTVLLQVSTAGELIKAASFFTLPFPRYRIIPYYQGEYFYDEYIAIGENEIVEISPSINLSLSQRWHTYLKYTVNTTGPYRKFKKIAPAMTHIAIKYDVRKGLDNSDAAKIKRLGYVPTDKLTRSIILGESAFDAGQSLDELELKSPTRALSTDIHFTKRDARLTELYLQASKNSANEVTAATAADIVLKWLTMENKSVEMIQEAMKVLDMSDNGLYQYLHVARLAAYVLAMNKKSLADSSTFKIQEGEPSFMTNTQTHQQHSIGSYYKLKSKKQRVMYNHLGEKIVNTTQLHSTISGGIAKGDGIALNDSFAAYPSRLMEHTLPAMSTQRDTIMTEVPEFFAKYFSSKFLTPFTLNSVWDPRDSNYFDNRRVVRIARALLDMRCVRQHETVQAAMHGLQGSNPATMERLLCLYFERSFGHARLNVSHHKIVNYLEAVLQNRDVPIVQFLQRYLCPRSSSEHLTDLTLWQYCELRHYLFAKGDAIEGPAMISEVHNPSEPVAPTSNVATYLITRIDAKGSLDEMFRIRGHYGVRCVQRLMSIVDGLPATDVATMTSLNTPNYNNVAQKDTVDMEAFLTAIALEFNNIQILLGEVHNLLFDKKHIPNFIVATSRDINTEISERIDVSQVKRNAAVQLSLDRLFALMSQFVDNDLKRTGTLDQITFRSVLVIAGQSILGFESGRDAHRLVDECIKRYTGDRPTGGVCYADFLATLVAQIVLGQGGSTGITGADAMEALKTVRIGMGEQQVAALVTTIGLMQCPPEENPYWTTGRTGAAEVEDKSVISKAGFWSVDSGSHAPPNNVPHSLSTHSFTEGGQMAIDLGDINVPGAETKQMKRKVLENSVSIVPETTRNMSSSLSGEIINLDQFAGRTPYIKPRALLTVNEVSMDGLDDALAANDAKVAHLGKQSYSHSLKQVYQDQASYTEDEESTVGFPTGRHSLAEYSVESAQSSNLRMSSYEVNLYLNEFKEEVDEKGEQNDVETLDYDTRKMQALEAEYQRRKAVFDEEEKQLALMQEEERLRFIQKREQKEQEMIYERAAAKAKERITLRFKRKEDKKRYARAEKGRALYKKAKEQEFKDLWAKNQEMLEKQLAEKERVRAIRAEKKAAEDEAKEKEREVAENILMRAEERRSHIVEKEIKEKEEKERAIREAKEAKEKADAEAKRRREAEIAEKKRIAEEKKAAEEAREREEEARREDFKLMRAEDINILTIPTPEELAAQEEERLAKEAEETRIKEEEEAKASELADAEEKAKESGGEVVIAADGSITVVEKAQNDEEEEEEKELSPLEMRMHDFLARIKVADSRNKSHPRKSEDKKQYFMPMLFANDIKYNSFSGTMNDEKKRLGEYSSSDRGKKPVRPQNPANFEEVDKMAKFKDIASAVQAHKIQLLQERLEMYGDNMGDIHPSEWTEVYKQDAVMWEEFFDAQEAILMARPPTPPPSIDEEAEFLKEMQKLDISEGISEEKSSFTGTSTTNKVPKSLPVPDDNIIKNLPPLPLNTVARDTVYPRSYKYFQIELMDCAKLTLELQCIRGYADLLFAATELPTIANYEKRVQAGDYNNRTARLTYVPHRQGVFYVGVHSVAGSKFELWGSDTGQVPTTADPLLQVSNQLRKWEIIQNHPPEEIEMKLPQLMDEAEKIVKFENNMARATILSEYNEALEKGEIDHDEDEDYDEIDIMDTFISKAGRRIIKKDLEMYGQVIIDEDGEEEELDVNPNAHKELFSKPDLMSHQSYLDLVQGQKPLSTRERIQLVRSQRPKMATSVSLPELNPKAIRAEGSLSSTTNATPDLTKSSSAMTFALPPFLKKPITKHDYTLVRFKDRLRIGSNEDKGD